MPYIYWHKKQFFTEDNLEFSIKNLSSGLQIPNNMTTKIILSKTRMTWNPKHCLCCQQQQWNLSGLPLGSGVCSYQISCCKWCVMSSSSWQCCSYGNFGHATPQGIHKSSKKPKGHLKILCIRRVKWSKFHTEDPQIIGATIQNLVPTATCSLGFVHSCIPPCFCYNLYANYINHTGISIRNNYGRS